ncbi:hypothetical protein DFH08DRAFT_820838 [Mycena albidolilacea]|uniref:Uncharacterized protein n=1 Tax=Mycena albidolilacea TaxID=1033008 RepID=A0AAD6ZBU5_9AGAR|nr:hypothetical protein DFH08DRAFT_820838 [Mycena albidolilacea]
MPIIALPEGKFTKREFDKVYKYSREGEGGEPRGPAPTSGQGNRLTEKSRAVLGNYEEISKSLRERDRSEAVIDVKQIPRRYKFLSGKIEARYKTRMVQTIIPATTQKWFLIFEEVPQRFVEPINAIEASVKWKGEAGKCKKAERWIASSRSLARRTLADFETNDMMVERRKRSRRSVPRSLPPQCTAPTTRTTGDDALLDYDLGIGLSVVATAVVSSQRHSLSSVVHIPQVPISRPLPRRPDLSGFNCGVDDAPCLRCPLRRRLFVSTPLIGPHRPMSSLPPPHGVYDLPASPAASLPLRTAPAASAAPAAVPFRSYAADSIAPLQTRAIPLRAGYHVADVPIGSHFVANAVPSSAASVLRRQRPPIYSAARLVSPLVLKRAHPPASHNPPTVTTNAGDGDGRAPGVGDGDNDARKIGRERARGKNDRTGSEVRARTGRAHVPRAPAYAEYSPEGSGCARFPSKPPLHRLVIAASARSFLAPTSPPSCLPASMLLVSTLRIGHVALCREHVLAAERSNIRRNLLSGRARWYAIYLVDGELRLGGADDESGRWQVLCGLSDSVAVLPLRFPFSASVSSIIQYDLRFSAGVLYPMSIIESVWDTYFIERNGVTAGANRLQLNIDPCKSQNVQPTLIQSACNPCADLTDMRSTRVKFKANEPNASAIKTLFQRMGKTYQFRVIWWAVFCRKGVEIEGGNSHIDISISIIPQPKALPTPFQFPRALPQYPLHTHPVRPAPPPLALRCTHSRTVAGTGHGLINKETLEVLWLWRIRLCRALASIYVKY